ncbi:MAG: hypothetical protein AAGA25_10595 [Planctomycetota bacterium]
MQTHYLSDNDVEGHLRDLFIRLGNTEHDLPWTAVCIGHSGRRVLKRLIDLHEKVLPPNMGFLQATWRHGDSEVQLATMDGQRIVSDGLDSRHEGIHARLANHKVLLIDSANHSGKTMRRIYDLLDQSSAAEVYSYALTTKRGSVFTPTLWALAMDDADRCYFLLSQKIPNQRLNADSKKQRPVQLVDSREVDETILVQNNLDGLVPDPDRYRAFVAFERGGIVGCLQVAVDPQGKDVLWVGRCEGQQSDKALAAEVQAILIRYAEWAGREHGFRYLKKRVSPEHAVYFQNLTQGTWKQEGPVQVGPDGQPYVVLVCDLLRHLSQSPNPLSERFGFRRN